MGACRIVRSSGSLGVPGAVDLLKGKDGDRMSIASAKRPGRGQHRVSPGNSSQASFSRIRYAAHSCVGVLWKYTKSASLEQSRTWIGSSPMTRSDFPRYAGSAQTGNKGVRIVENIIHDEFGWIFREQEGQKDFGIDAHIELVERDRVLGRMLAVQIKCGESYLKKKAKDGFIFTGEQKHLNYFLNYPVPVLITLCHPETKQCWWCEVDPTEMEEAASGWQITVPFTQSLDVSAREKLSRLAGPVKDYIPELRHFWSVNNLLEKYANTLCIVVAREDVESGDIDMALGTLKRISLNKRLARNHKDKVDISIFGYRDDPRELYEIPEVRRWVNKLDRQFPYWFFFLSKKMPGLGFITLALCDYSRRPDGKPELEKSSWARFMDAHFTAMNQICESLEFSVEEIKELSEDVIAYYIGERPPPSPYASEHN